MEQIMKGQRTGRLFATAGKIVAAINSGYKVVINTPNGATEVAAIVRCKDCCRWLPMNRFHEDYHPGRGDCEWMGMVTDSDWFCSEGKKRSD